MWKNFTIISLKMVTNRVHLWYKKKGKWDNFILNRFQILQILFKAYIDPALSPFQILLFFNFNSCAANEFSFYILLTNSDHEQVEGKTLIVSPVLKHILVIAAS